MNTWFYRKIRNGRIKLNGEWHYPDNSPREYDGRLDGMTFLFYIYTYPDKKGLAVIWGPKEMADAKTKEELNLAWKNRPDVVDGVFCWMSWRTKENREEKEKRDYSFITYRGGLDKDAPNTSQNE